MSSPGINRERLFNLFSELVDCYSPSGKEEAVTALLKARLVEAGLPVELQPISETRSNIIVRTSPDADILFLGHIDTVPAFDIEQYSFSFDGEICSGLGTADMKGGCAAMVEAFLSKAEDGGLPSSAALALVVGEEETGDGTAALLESRSFSAAIVAEPTALKPALKHYGYVEMLVKAFGYRRHAAMSDSRTNAIRSMLRALLAMETFVEQGDTAAVLNIRDLISSEAGFAVPDRCSAIIDIHIPPGNDARAYSEELETFVRGKLADFGASGSEISFATLADGFTTDLDADLTKKLKSATEACGIGWEQEPFRSHSDANLLHDAGCSTVIFGPGQLAKAHTRDESVPFDQVIGAADVYHHFLASLS